MIHITNLWTPTFLALALLLPGVSLGSHSATQEQNAGAYGCSKDPVLEGLQIRTAIAHGEHGRARVYASLNSGGAKCHMTLYITQWSSNLVLSSTDITHQRCDVDPALSTNSCEAWVEFSWAFLEDVEQLFPPTPLHDGQVRVEVWVQTAVTGERRGILPVNIYAKDAEPCEHDERACKIGKQVGIQDDKVWDLL